MHWKMILSWLVVLAVIAWLGVFAGRRVLQWRVDRAHDEKLSGLDVGEATSLRAGMEFPDVLVTAPNGQRVQTGELLVDRRHIVVFVSAACDACSIALARWAEELEELPDDVTVFAITDGVFSEAIDYAERNELRFALYVDESDLFAAEHGVDVIPTAVGVDAERRIRFVQHGIPDNFGLEAAIEALSAPLPR